MGRAHQLRLPFVKIDCERFVIENYQHSPTRVCFDGNKVANFDGSR